MNHMADGWLLWQIQQQVQRQLPRRIPTPIVHMTMMPILIGFHWHLSFRSANATPGTNFVVFGSELSW